MKQAVRTAAGRVAFYEAVGLPGHIAMESVKKPVCPTRAWRSSTASTTARRLRASDRANALIADFLKHTLAG